MSEKITTRAIAPRPSTIREEDRSVEFVISSEERAAVWDWERNDIVDEILLQGGLKVPGNKQVPLLDSHSRESVTDILGSMRDIRQEGDTTVGRAYFSRKQKAYDTYQDVRDGHLDSVSVGYVVRDAVYIPSGVRAAVAGREYDGPVKVTTAWELREVSTVAIPADKNAKVRSEAGEKPQEETQDSNGQAAGTENQQEEESMENITTPTPPAVDPKAIADEAIKAERERASQIRTACEKAGMPEKINELIDSGKTADQARLEIIENLKPSTPITTARIEMGMEDGEKFTRAAADALVMKALGKRFVEKPADGADQMAGIGFLSLASEVLRRNGINPAFMGRDQIIRSVLSLRSSSAIPTLGISDFSHILENVATKAMMAGWQYAPTTYQAWCRIGDLPDFKAARRVNLSDAPDLLETPEGAEIQAGTMSDTGENIQLVTYARRLIITRQALVNDDLSAFDMIFRAFGSRAANLVNSLPYAVLITNAAIHDTGTLFNTTAIATTGGHANQAGTGAAISTSTLQAGEAAMMAQVAPNGSKLNITPRFLLSGAAYKSQAVIVTGSASLTDSQYNQGVINPFYNVLSPIADANITGNKWFLVADPTMFNTMEVAFLGENRAPTISQEDTSPVLGVEFKAFIDATAKALDFRAMYYNAGA